MMTPNRELYPKRYNSNRRQAREPVFKLQKSLSEYFVAQLWGASKVAAVAAVFGMAVTALAAYTYGFNHPQVPAKTKMNDTIATPSHGSQDADCSDSKMEDVRATSNPECSQK